MAEKKATAKILDMTDVKEGGQRFNTKRVPAGDYLARVTRVEDAEVKNGDNKGAFQWLFTISPEKFPTGKYPYYCQLAENQLWKVRNLLIAAGLNVPKKKIKLDPEKVVGKLIAITLEDDEYDGKAKSVVAAVFPPSEMEGGADDDEEDEDTDEDEDEDEEEEKPAPKKAKKAKKAPEPEEDEDDEDEDEEDEPAPAKKSKKAAGKKRKVTDEELEELDIEDV